MVGRTRRGLPNDMMRFREHVADADRFCNPVRLNDDARAFISYSLPAPDFAADGLCLSDRVRRRRAHKFCLDELCR
jgi:glucuronate isomerase